MTLFQEVTSCLALSLKRFVEVSSISADQRDADTPEYFQKEK